MAISVPTETLEPGMVLAEPVFNRLGQIILSKGCKLSLRRLTILKTWGIPTAVIENGEAEVRNPLLDEKIRRRALARVNKRLSWHPHNSLEEEIVHLAVQQAVQRSLQGGP